MRSLFFPTFFTGLILANSTVLGSLLTAEDFISLPLQNAIELVKGKTIQQGLDQEFLKTAYKADLPFEKRWKSLMLYSQLRKKESFAELEKASQRSEWFLRSAALTAAQVHLEPEKARPILEKSLFDKALVVRSLAVELLAQSLTDSSRALFWQELDKPYNFHKNQSLWIRPQLAKALANKAHPDEKSKWQTLAKDKDPQIKLIAKNALKKL